MLKFESIIRNLTLDEKISFITSDVKYENIKVENYDLPSFKIQTLEDFECLNSDLKISYKSLFSSWNESLAKKYFNKIYGSINNQGKIVGIEIKDKNKKFIDNAFPSDYLLGSFAKKEIEVVNSKGFFSCITDFPRIYYDSFDFNEITPYLIALNEKPKSIILKTIDALDYVNRYTKFEGFKFFEADYDSDVVTALNNGAVFIFYNNAKEAILNALDRYEIEKSNLEDNIITRSEFDELLNKGEILSMKKLDEILNEYFKMLLLLDDSYKVDSSASDEELGVNEIVNDLAESIIVLKNEDVLPIEGNAKIGIIGDFASNFQTLYGKSNFNDIVAKYDLDIVGYSHGFIEEKIDLEEVYESATKIALQSKYILLFLGKYNKNQLTLPEKEIELIRIIKDAISGTEHKIIAICNTDDYIDYNFESDVDALIQTNMLNKYGINAVFNVILGINIPSGKLVKYYEKSSGVLDILDYNTYNYQLGLGMSYGLFDYNDLSISKQGVTFTIRNNGALGAYDTPQLYISSQSSNEISYRLCGFKKAFIESNETMKFFIPFDEFAFKVFDENLKKYVIRKGYYQIAICNMANNNCLVEDVMLDDFIYDEHTATNNIEYEFDIKKAYKSLIEDENKQAYLKNDKKMGKGKKIFIATIIAIYYNVLLAFIFIANLLGSRYLAVTISVIALLAIFDVSFIGYLVILVKQKTEKGIDINDDVTEVIKDMGNFDCVSEITYEKPIQVVEEEKLDEATEEIEENETIEQQVEEEKELIYDKSVTEYVDGNNYSNDIDFLSYTDDFVKYALNSGLIVEPRTARSVLGALASSKMIFLKSQDESLTLKFSEILTKYLSSDFAPINLEEVESKDNLYWQIGDQDVVYRSKLANDILQAKKNYKRFYVETLYNVDVEKTELIDDFMNYALDPNNSVELSFGTDEDKVLINKNVFFLVIPKDELFLEKINEKIASSSMVLEIFVRENEIISEEPTINYVLSYTMLEEKIKENRQKLYIDEDNWKKLDDIEEDISNIESFSIDNRMTLAFEKLASVMLEAGSDIAEVVDYAVAMKIVPYIKLLKSYKNQIDESNFKNIIVNHLGDDTIPVSERALKKPL